MYQTIKYKSTSDSINGDAESRNPVSHANMTPNRVAFNALYNVKSPKVIMIKVQYLFTLLNKFIIKFFIFFLSF